MAGLDPITAALNLGAELAQNYRQAFAAATPEQQKALVQPMVEFVEFWGAVGKRLLPPAPKETTPDAP